MDRARARTRLLSAVALSLLLAAAADTPPLAIAEARWLNPDVRIRGLTRTPAECLKQPINRSGRDSVAIGRAAFRAPLLLGGQAARAGLSCASCHRNGRGNPDFSFPGLSGPPGTADVTSSFMSSRRGDGTFNPKPIPDLAGPVRSVDQARQSGALERFIQGLIVEEFDGSEPPRAVLRGLADYVRAMESAACPGHAFQEVTLRSMLADTDAALGAALLAGNKGDAETMRLLIGAARSAMGRIDERFQPGRLETERQLLRQADRDLQTVQRMRPEAATKEIRRWRRTWRGPLSRLKRVESQSLFAPAILEERLSR
jgi:hypothetical protein